MGMSQIKLVGMLSMLTVTRVMSQASCVQLNTQKFSSCPCEDATLAFTLEGETTVAAHTVNLAVILDGSGSVSADDFKTEQVFSENVVAAFAKRNLFDNGGTASYVQYAKRLQSSGTFNSKADFNAFADADTQARGGTTTSVGIKEGTKLLGKNPASASFMIVITDGRSTSISDTRNAANAARDAGIVVFAVGVGSETNPAELLAIGGHGFNVYEVAEFDLLDAALQKILSSGKGLVIPCESTGAEITIEFGVPVDSTYPKSLSTTTGRTVTFSVGDLEATPTDFDVMLNVCNEAPGSSIILSVDYRDDQRNKPDLTALKGMVVGNDLCPAAPTPAPTPKPTSKTNVNAPKRTDNLNKGKAIDTKYLGCYVPKKKNKLLDGPVTTYDGMTTQMCAKICDCLDWQFFATANGSECHCGSGDPAKKKKKGTCDYECSGEPTTACGGVGSISVYQNTKFKKP